MINSFVSQIVAVIMFSLLSASGRACTEAQKTDLRHYELQASELINNWLFTLENRYRVDVNSVLNRDRNRSSNSQSQAEMAVNIILCSQNILLQGFEYECTGLTKYKATTLPIVGRRVEISNSRFWEARHPSRVAMILHEATHKCGTNDATYFKSDERPRNHRLFGWATIASTYERWAEQGLCLPGYDCQ